MLLVPIFEIRLQSQKCGLHVVKICDGGLVIGNSVVIVQRCGFNSCVTVVTVVIGWRSLWSVADGSVHKSVEQPLLTRQRIDKSPRHLLLGGAAGRRSALRADIC